MSQDPYEVIGVGFGPANLALTEAGDEPAAKDRTLGERALFFDRKPRFGWHRDMLIEGATMQVSSEAIAIRARYGDGAADHLEVDVRADGETSTYRTRNVVIGAGLVPKLPKGACWLAANLAQRRAVEPAGAAAQEPRQLRAAVTVAPGAQFDATRATAELRPRLPARSVPVSIVVFDESPGTPSGKLDRDTVARLVASFSRRGTKG